MLFSLTATLQPRFTMSLKTILPTPRIFAVAALAAFTVLAAGAQSAAATSENKAPIPTKAEVLAAIAAIEKDPLSDEGLGAIQIVALFSANSDTVQLEITELTAPWLHEDGNPNDPDMAKKAAHVLLGSYFAGSVQAQMKKGKPADDPRAGWLFVIRTYNHFTEQSVTKLSFPSIKRLEMLESQGWLAEYAGVVMQDIKNARARREIPAAEKLSRDYLSPARDLRNKGKFKEAYALYEAWLAQNPYDAEIHFDLGYALSLQASAGKNKKVAAELTKKARTHALMAAALGSKDPLLQSLLTTTAPNYDKTKEAPFSDVKKAHDFIDRAEKAFSQRRYDDAAKLYKEALKHDPKSYIATLYVGDSYYAAGNFPPAIEWFRKAIALDQNKETAHRYLADALRKSGKPKEALVEYVAALVAEPYAKLPHSMLERIAQDVNPLFKPSPLRGIPRMTVELDASGEKLTVGVASRADQNAMTDAYVDARADWIRTERTKRLLGEAAKRNLVISGGTTTVVIKKDGEPDMSGAISGINKMIAERLEAEGFSVTKTTPHRHCAAEEAAGLRAFAAKVFELNDKKDDAASNWLAAAVAIKNLDGAGLLEAAVYIERASKDIAQDYPAYREKNREMLARYLREFWLGQTR